MIHITEMTPRVAARRSKAADARAKEVRRLVREGCSREEVCRRLCIHATTFARLLAGKKRWQYGKDGRE